MWVLLLIVTMVLPTEIVVSVTPVLTYSDLKTCDAERIRIKGEFDAYYPKEEQNYELVCKPVRRAQ